MYVDNLEGGFLKFSGSIGGYIYSSIKKLLIKVPAIKIKINKKKDFFKKAINFNNFKLNILILKKFEIIKI